MDSQSLKAKQILKTKNVWYVLAKIDETAKHGFSPAERKGVYHNKLESAIEQKDRLEELRSERIYILERTCEVIL